MTSHTGQMKWYLFCRIGRERKWSRCNRFFPISATPANVEFVTLQVPADWRMAQAGMLLRKMAYRFHRTAEPGRSHVVSWSSSADYRVPRATRAADKTISKWRMVKSA